ncbi:MAG: aquaporin [Planctomycetaceae bacterium]
MAHVGKAAIVEAIGTFVVVFFTVASIMSGGTLLEIALAYGLAAGVALTLSARVSGGVCNPAIQVGLWVTGRSSSARTLVYLGAQLAGAVLAAAVLRWIEPSLFAQVDGGTPTVAPALALGKATVLEAITTAVVVWAYFASVVEDRGAFSKIAGLAVGFAVTLGVLASQRLTGAAMNPARWFGPALVSGRWSDWWVFVLGPLAGGIVAAVGYWWLFLRGRAPATP